MIVSSQTVDPKIKNDFSCSRQIKNRNNVLYLELTLFDKKGEQIFYSIRGIDLVFSFDAIEKEKVSNVEKESIFFYKNIQFTVK